MKALHADEIVARLVARGVTHVVGLPDNGSRVLFARLNDEDRIDVVGVTREGEAFAIAAGLFAGGQYPLVLVQNTGLLESGDAFRGTLFNMAFPVLMLIGYRGYETRDREPGRVDTAASFLEPTLKAWEIPFWLIEGDDDLHRFDEAQAWATKHRRAVALVYPGETI